MLIYNLYIAIHTDGVLLINCAVLIGNIIRLLYNYKVIKEVLVVQAAVEGAH